MEASLMFHNVGQGLFYSGQIKCENESNFNFVYDCGGVETTPRSRSLTLDTCIDRHTTYLAGQDIDMLVISHFHSDHINGISKLLEKNKINDIIIPFYTFEERLLIQLHECDTYRTNDQISFLVNPYQFLMDKGVQRIIVITHQQNNDGMRIDKSIDLDKLISVIPDGNEYDELRNNNSIIVKTDKEPIKKDCWHFAFYADVKFKGKFNSSLAKNRIEDLKNATTEQDRQKAIKEIKASYNVSSGQMNETSLIMVHKCDNCTKPMDMYQFPNIGHGILWSYKRCHSSLINEPQIHILTGDFNFKTTCWNDVKKHFGTFIDSENLVMQIAHHGSIDNWDIKILADAEHSLFVIPFGAKNRYGHPSIEVEKDIVVSNNCLFEVTEKQSLMMFYK